MKRIILIPCLCVLCFIGSVTAQRVGPGKPIIQSPYYDAIVLYYAFQNINAYPLPSTGVQVGSIQGTNGNNSNKPTQPTPAGLGANTRFNNPTSASDAAGAATQIPAAGLSYTIIESSSGKILLDNFSGNLDSIMKTFRFDVGEQKPFITSVLARNTKLTDSSDTGILSAYQQNPYLNAYLRPIFSEVSGFTGIKSRTIDFPDIYKSYNYSISPLGGGGPSFATLAINAYTDYIIDAVNAEIDDAFFIHLQEALEKYPELPLLFPNVMDGLRKIQVTKYKQSINLLKSGYQEDMRNLLANVSKLATLQKYRDLINKHPWLTLIFITCDLIDYIKKGNIPADILYQINASDYIQCVYANDYSSILKLAALISYCLRDIKMGDENTNSIGWVDQNKLNLMKNNAAFFEIFTGLMAANADSIHFKNGFDFRTALYKNDTAILKTRYIVYNFSQTVDHIKTSISQTLEALKNNNPTTISAYSGYYKNVGSDLLGLSGNALAILPANKAEPATKEIKKTHIKLGPLFSQANKVITKIEAKEYNAAVYDMDTLLQQLFIGGLDDSTDYREIKYKKFEDTYIKYGSFIATIASSQSEEDMKNAIKSFALPTGSSRIKKEHYFSVGLNSYVGFTHSWNKLYPPLNIPSQENWFTVPLGISFNYGLNKFGSISLFGGIIDVGAIFTYKINSDSAVQPTITFAQIFSPSIGIVYGLPIIKKYNIPLSVGANFQWGPTLQKVDQTGNSVLPLMTRRFNVFIAVDIPMVNFYVSKQY